MVNHKLHRGFTLIEVMITVAIVGILASIAYPSYVDSITRSNRSEGQRELLRIANLQEQFYVDNRTYTNNMALLNLGIDPFITENGHYSIDVEEASPSSSFTLTATAQGVQASNDSRCATLTVTETGQKSATNTDCWEN